jgi:tetratricopeptide (TPR) repeat protein
VLAVVAVGSALYAWQQLRTNEAFLAATLRTATEIVSTAVAQAEKYHVPRAATLELLTKAEGLFDNMARYGRPTPQLQYEKAWMLIQFARSYVVLGDTGRQLAHAKEAYGLLAGLAARVSDDTIYQRDLSVAYNEIGDVLVARGNLPDALKSFRDGLAISDRLAQSDPGNAGWQRDLIVSCVKLAEIDPSQARVFLTRASEIAQQMQQRDNSPPGTPGCPPNSRDGSRHCQSERRVAATPRLPGSPQQAHP